MRNVKKSIDEYKKRFAETNKGTFVYSDYYQIHKMSDNNFELIDNACMFAFMVGYRCAKREYRKNRKEK